MNDEIMQTCNMDERTNEEKLIDHNNQLQQENTAYAITVQNLEAELDAVKVSSIRGYIENMNQIDYEANIRGEAGLRMMASFAAKTAEEYANNLEGKK